MNCEKCGGNLSLEEVKCPHCGTPNKHAQLHVKDMYRYQGEFADTQKDVYAVTRNFKGIAVRAVIIMVLLILAVIFAVIGSESYTIKRTIKENIANVKVEEYSATLDQYLAEEDYIGFCAFMETNHIDTYDTDYQKYYQLESLTRKYRYLYSYIMKLQVMKGEEDAESDWDNQVRYTCDQLLSFYSDLDTEKYSFVEEVDSPENKMIREQILNNVKALLQTYCGFTREDVANLDTMSEAEIMMLFDLRTVYVGGGAENAE